MSVPPSSGRLMSLYMKSRNQPWSELTWSSLQTISHNLFFMWSSKMNVWLFIFCIFQQYKYCSGSALLTNLALKREVLTEFLFAMVLLFFFPESAELWAFFVKRKKKIYRSRLQFKKFKIHKYFKILMCEQIKKFVYVVKIFCIHWCFLLMSVIKGEKCISALMLTQAEICTVSSKLKNHFLEKTYLENYF